MVDFLGNGTLLIDPLPVIDVFKNIEMPYCYHNRLILPSQPPDVDDVTKKMRFGQYSILLSRN